MRVAMIGTGYVGLVTGACLADFGHVVTCVDKDPAKIEGLLAGRMPIYEPGLEDLVARNVREKRLSFTTELAPAVRVNLVELGIVADPEADADPLRTHRLATRSLLGRFGTPEDVVHVVLSLLDSTWATGEIWGVGR